MFGSDAGSDETSVDLRGVMLALLGTAEPDVLQRWFDRLAEGGKVIDPLAEKPWGASDGQVVDLDAQFARSLQLRLVQNGALQHLAQQRSARRLGQRGKAKR